MGKPVLQTKGLEAFYGDFQALFGIDFEIYEGETVAIIGSNGAGKSTFLRSITGMLPSRGQDISFLGDAIDGIDTPDLVKRGLTMVPEGRKLFPSLSVEENLLIGAYGRSGDKWTLDSIYDLFPILGERRHHGGTELSGGQQQMVAIGRGLMSNPKLLLCDEISLGLAPIIIKDIYDAVPKIKERGATMIVVEQDVSQAMAIADRVYCFQEGRVSLTGRPDEVTRDQISAAYFGLEQAEKI
ncbi:MAG: ABC transporter ATP-binding protein [Gammaproteobacteria bacterium]|nr:ABC transporter ATP-binding protein [Gammaproteobacteria bacterium]